MTLHAIIGLTFNCRRKGEFNKGATRTRVAGTFIDAYTSKDLTFMRDSFTVCSENNFITGIMLFVQQAGGDDTSVNGAVFMCLDNKLLEPSRGIGESPSALTRCQPGYAVCGYNAKYDDMEGGGPGDNTGLNNVRIMCCPL
jgi:hypothetical protein